ncbi:MAG TPA: hypothetical protein VGR62_18460 [Candidatus Binatia bacterium]|jgi:uncharacterized delta-60 repeat protein|nr:hypothetical protein [Candidatus Binatia bacterium]
MTRRTSLVAIALVATVWSARAGTGDDDPTFGVDGFSSAIGSFAVVRPDDTVRSFGNVFTGDQVAAKLTQATADGALDLTFGGNGTGTRIIPVPNHNVFAQGLLRQSGGRTIGFGILRPDGDDDVAGLFGFLDDGSLDATFGVDGVVAGPALLATSVQTVFAALLPDDRIAVLTIGPSSMLLSLYLADGTTDPGFGDGAPVSMEVLVEPAITTSPSGQIVIAGVLPPNTLTVRRYDTDGSIDTDFRSLPFGAIAARVTDVMVLPDGSVLTLGTTRRDAPNGQAFLTKVQADGFPDLGFGSGGIVYLRHFALHTEGVRMRRQSDGRVLLLSSALRSGNVATFVLARLTADGALDPTFGTGGRVIVGGEALRGSLILQSDGRAIVAHDAAQRFETGCPALPDADGDGIGDACDPCTGGSVVTGSRLNLKGSFASPGGWTQLTWRGKVTTSLAGFAPTSNGPLLLIEDANGRVVTSTWLPANAFLSTTGQAKWTVSGSRFIYKDRGKPGPLVDGILSVSVKRASGGVATISVKEKGATYRVDPSALPLRATLVLVPPRGAGDQCVVSAFAPGGCTLKGGTKLSCR